MLTKFINQFLLSTAWIIFLLKRYEVATLTVLKVSQFPHSTDDLYNITISYLKNSTQLSNSLVIRISDESNNKLEEAIFDYGFKNQITEEFSGEFIKIPMWKKMNDEKTIFVTIFFNNKSDKKIIEIYQIEAESEKLRYQMLDNLSLAKIIYRSKITLITPPKMKFSINSKYARFNEFYDGQIGIAICQGIGGILKFVPIFNNLNNFTIVSSSLSIERNERKFEFLVSPSDHMKTLTCQLGELIKSISIKVYHHPTIIKLEPTLQDQFINDSIIMCKGINGYPIPTSEWKFVKGPQDADKMYRISIDNKYLHIKVDKIDESIWTFNCSARNILPNSFGYFNKTISFIVIDKFGSDKSNFSKVPPIIKFNHTFSFNDFWTIKRDIIILMEMNDKQNRKIEKFLEENKNLSIEIKDIKIIKKKYDESLEIKANSNKHLKQLNKTEEIIAKEINKFNLIYNKKLENLSTEKNKLEFELKILKENFNQLKSDVNNIVNLINDPSKKIYNSFKTTTKSPYKNENHSRFRNSSERLYNMKGYPPFNILPSSVWKIEKVNLKRKKGFNVIGNYFYSDYNANKMRLLFFPNGYEKSLKEHLSIVLYIIFGIDDDLYQPFKGDIIIGIYNSRNQFHNKIITKYAELDRASNRITYDFSYQELNLSAVLLNDEIIIKCFVVVKY